MSILREHVDLLLVVVFVAGLTISGWAYSQPDISPISTPVEQLPQLAGDGNDTGFGGG